MNKLLCSGLTAGVSSGEWHKPPAVSFLFRIIVPSLIYYVIRIFYKQIKEAEILLFIAGLYKQNKVIRKTISDWISCAVHFLFIKGSRGKSAYNILYFA